MLQNLSENTITLLISGFGHSATYTDVFLSISKTISFLTSLNIHKEPNTNIFIAKLEIPQWKIVQIQNNPPSFNGVELNVQLQFSKKQDLNAKKIVRKRVYFLTPSIVHLKQPEEILNVALNRIGEVESIRIFRNPEGDYKGFGFCEFSSEESRTEALRMKNFLFLGKEEMTFFFNKRRIKKAAKDAMSPPQNTDPAWLDQNHFQNQEQAYDYHRKDTNQ